MYIDIQRCSRQVSQVSVSKRLRAVRVCGAFVYVSWPYTLVKKFRPAPAFTKKLVISLLKYQDHELDHEALLTILTGDTVSANYLS